MACILKNSCIFELRLIPNSNGANTETKLQRGRTVASTAVIFMRRMGVDRSDPFSLFNQNLFIMRSNDESASAQGAISADEILNDLLLFDDVSNLRKALQSTTVETLVNEDDHDSRDQVYCYFLALNDFFDKLEAYQNQSKLKLVS